MRHISKEKFILMKDKKMVIDIVLITNYYVDDISCVACIVGKQAQLPFSKCRDKEYMKKTTFYYSF